MLRPLCGALHADAAFSVSILAGGMACSEAFGHVSRSIRDQGFAIAVEMPWEVEHAHAADQASDAMQMTGSALADLKPDALILLGDRYETAAAALAATVQRAPIIHLYGGEETEGAFDNSLRHAITKLSHLHLVSHEAYAGRIRQMGEDPKSVHVVGSLCLDNLRNQFLPSREQLETRLGISLNPPVGVVTLHPTTLAGSAEGDELAAVIQAMESFPATWVVTLPNSDPGSEAIRSAFLAVAARRGNVVAVPALGEEHYLGLLKVADLMLGNSSSGMIEAPAVGLPTVNVGDRQRGRIRGASILDVAPDPRAVLSAITHSQTLDFRRLVRDAEPPYGKGNTAERIVALLRSWRPPRPARKVFFDGFRSITPGKTE